VRAAATLRPCLCFRCVRGRNGSSLGFARGRGRGLGRGTREQHHQPPEEKKEKKAEEKEKASPEGGGVKAQMRRSVWATTRKAAPKLTNTPPCGAWCLRAGCAGWPLCYIGYMLHFVYFWAEFREIPLATELRFSFEVTPVTNKRTTNARGEGQLRHATPPCWRGCTAVSLPLVSLFPQRIAPRFCARARRPCARRRTHERTDDRR
jgi:hypothetical protein